ncbi:TRAP transporter, DctM subunit [Desulfosporosinus orientis DSM 765]|uniref:TRAP transporter, DctM subunit n=1 Tax=Desulfosporosinus orientis (strain ATCC 19365 / DSM 765 / NCIMB 8382 / VKM B-1628 / Singapore I) TaxID=768706 RepID=G7WIY9_DESOD|nr:TRAP transporter large permease [Desulfosporosinus orientis]AET69714.1 TRAP transporter, DctM subunit [Desulfosporosinus orientis DSM 765]
MTSILFGGFAILAILGLPIAVVLGLTSVIALATATSIPLLVVPQRMFTAVSSFPLMAIPFFMIAGVLMEGGGISRRLINLANKIVGHLTGGLAMVAILTCMFFAAISGSGPATVAAIGGIMIPAMVSAGYDLGFSAAVMAAAGSIGVIIPPSIPMVTYGVVAGASIGSLFLGGLTSGLLVGLALMIPTYYIAKKRGYKGTGKFNFKEVLIAGKEAFWAILMPVIILGGIYGGIFTPTEAAAVAVVYGFIVGVFVYKELKFTDLGKLLANAAASTSIVMLIIAAASIFGWIMTSERIPDAVAQAFVSFSDSKIVILLLINLLLLIVGCFMETNAAIIILAPIFLPLVVKMGVDPIQFGLIMVVNTAIGMFTPPLGVNLFVACGQSNLSIERISKAIIPYIIAMVAAVLLITYIPAISMYLPNLMMK